jgi:hypothetical protein
MNGERERERVSYRGNLNFNRTTEQHVSSKMNFDMFHDSDKAKEE